MEEHFKELRRFSLALISLPILCGVVSAWFWALGFLLTLFCLLMLVIALPTGAIILSARGFKVSTGDELSGRDRWQAAAATPIACIVMLLLVGPTFAACKHVGTWTRLVVNRATYDDILQRVRSGERPHHETNYRGVTYYVDQGPPLRLAFHPEGILDNWSGIVFDPTGELRQADRFDESGQFRAPDRITKVFGGDLVSCRSLGHPWYDCSFT